MPTNQPSWSVFILLLIVCSINQVHAQEPYDHGDLTVFRDASGPLKPIASTDDWNQRREHILLGMQEAMGPMPRPRPQPDFDVRVTERTKGNGFERKTISIVVEGTDRVTADLYLPTARQTDEKRPAVLALHPTGALGKRIVAGAKPNRQYATELAERGYVVIAPDYPSFGELKNYDFAADDYVSGTMKGIVNHMRCVDYLQSLDEVDPGRIAAIGHSLGGHNALFVGAFDKRIKVVVTSCGWTPFHYYYGGKVKGWTSDRYMPLIRDKFELNADKMPFDFYEVIAAIAPRAVFSASPIDDANFAVAGIKDAEPKIRTVFNLVSAKQADSRFVVEYPQCKHDFPKPTRSRAYAFIDKHLKFSPVSNTDFRAELPRIAATEPDNALATFTVHPDFELELVAHEPNVVDPIAACFDAYGRMYVVEMRGYSEQRDQKLGRIRRLEDRDNDGVFEYSSVFADGLKWPTAIVPYDNGVFVAAAPHIYYLKDGLVRGDDDDLADSIDGEYPIILTGLKHSNVQGLANSMRWGLDGRIHVATSSSGAELRRPNRPGTPALSLRGRDFSFDPRIVWQTIEAADIDPRLKWGEKEWQAESKRIVDRWVAIGAGQVSAEEEAERIVQKARRDVAAFTTQRQYARPRKPSLRAESGGGQHGMCFDDHFRKFVCQNSDHIQFVRYEDRYAARATGVVAPRSRRSIAVDGPQAEVFRLSQTEPWRLVRTRLRVAGLVRGPVEGGGRAAGYFTGATGTTIYRGHNWPEEYRGQAFVGDVGSNIVHRKILEPDGLGFRANRARENVEFIASTDNWFRPVQFLNGPDGNLYILDMYRETIEHPASLPPQIKRHLDLNSGRDRGRIYRVVSKRTKRKRGLQPVAMPARKLVALLDSPNAWTRETAARLLLERQRKETVEPLKQLVRNGTSLGRLSALHSLNDVRLALDEETLLVALADKDPIIRERAVRLGESRLNRWEKARARIAALADDPNAQVRAQVAFSAYRLSEALVPVVTKILKRDSHDEIIRFAAVASSKDHAFAVLGKLASDAEFRRTPSGAKSLSMLADLATREGAAGEILKLGLQLPDADRILTTTLLQPVAKVAAGKKELSQGLTRFAERGMQMLEDRSKSAVERIAACRQLVLHTDKDRAVTALVAVVDQTQPTALQLAAIEALKQLRSNQVAADLLGSYRKLTPGVQEAVVVALLSREGWTEQLLEAVAKHDLPSHTISQAQLTMLRNSRSEKINQLVRQLTQNFQSTPRSKVVANWQDVLALKGDAKKGRDVFRKNCAKCHRLEGFGEQIGPGLAAIRNRGIDAVLLAILDPNREVNPQYTSYSVLTSEGRSFSGMIVSETASGITLRDGEKTNATIRRDELDTIRNSGMSLMPEGLEKTISKQQMSDLLRYLMTVESN